MAGAIWCIVEDDRKGSPKKVMAEVLGEATRLGLGPVEAVWLTDTATEADHRVCEEWLQHAGLAGRLDAAERWVAAMWSFAVDDAKVQTWCRRVLLAR